MQRNTWKKFVLVVVMLAVIGIGAHYLLGSAGKSAAKDHATTAQTVPVKIARAQRGNLDLSLKVIGSAEAYSTVNVQSRVDGQLLSLSFKPGGRVRQGETIIRIDPSLLQSQLDQALGNLAKDQAQLVNAQSLLKRYTPLLAKGYVAQSDVDTYKANEGLYAASVKADNAAVELARTQLSYAQIHAPVDSIAGAPLVYPGAQVSANSTNLVVLNQVRPIYITFSIPQSALAGLKASYARGALPVTAKIPGSQSALQASLDFINNAVDTSTGTIQLKASYANTDDELTPGQFVEVTLPTTRLTKVVTVPVVALQNSPNGSFVFVVAADGTVQQRMVTAGESSGNQIVIDKGLDGGEQVVTDGQLLLVNGTHVHVVSDNG
ncbi:efflux RND transporter periplasmic adaptor subunit [Rhodanobacter sp. C03]|uniref:efflux RND transporter periplasmic adaptor subunit n=1 Tax=Rhodanobacter sp. C03 TaxID=1945858 RepID=UPI0009CFEBFD|nr:efflux RND transporter periplasmic adaptor subunit [Rhodanobacter sp. C03]OOG59633.1 efflux transporter periplasmic adaptor subunit [Rhodanobacter sp. C03]